MAPARGGATSDTPGINRPMMKAASPQRSNARAVFPVQVLGNSENLQSSLSILAPNRRPAANQIAFPIRVPATTAEISRERSVNSDNAAPPSITVGVSGIGRPISCNSVWKNTMTMPRRPNSCSSKSIWFQPEYSFAGRGTEGSKGHGTSTICAHGITQRFPESEIGSQP
jgi:hypothetical protein